MGQKWYYLSPENLSDDRLSSLSPRPKWIKIRNFDATFDTSAGLCMPPCKHRLKRQKTRGLNPHCVKINNLYSSLPILKRQNSQLHWAGWNPTWTACLSVILRVRNTHEKLAPDSEQVCIARVYRNHYCNVLSPTLSSMVFTHNSRCIVNHRTSSVARTAPCTNDNKLSSQPAPSRLPDGRPALPDNKRLCTGSMHNFRSGTLCYGEQFGK